MKFELSGYSSGTTATSVLANCIRLKNGCFSESVVRLLRLFLGIPVFVLLLGSLTAAYAAVDGSDMYLDASVTPQFLLDGMPTSIDIGGIDGGTVEMEEQRWFTAVAPVRIDLISVTGDADLIVYSRTPFEDSNIVCRSSVTSAVDSCDLPGTGTIQILVRGFRRSIFQIRAVQRDAAPANAPITLSVGERASGRLSGNGFVWFVFDAPAQVNLETLSGRQSLRVYGNTTFSNESLVCTSSDVSGINSCDLEGSGVANAVVIGNDAGEYQLSLGPVGGATGPEEDTGSIPDQVPADDAPLLLSGGSSGGSGALSYLAFLFLAASALIRHLHVRKRKDFFALVRW